MQLFPYNLRQTPRQLLQRRRTGRCGLAQRARKMGQMNSSRFENRFTCGDYVRITLIPSYDGREAEIAHPALPHRWRFKTKAGHYVEIPAGHAIVMMLQADDSELVHVPEKYLQAMSDPGRALVSWRDVTSWKRPTA